MKVRKPKDPHALGPHVAIQQNTARKLHCSFLFVRTALHSTVAKVLFPFWLEDLKQKGSRVISVNLCSRG